MLITLPAANEHKLHIMSYLIIESHATHYTWEHVYKGDWDPAMGTGAWVTCSHDHSAGGLHTEHRGSRLHA